MTTPKPSASFVDMDLPWLITVCVFGGVALILSLIYAYIFHCRIRKLRRKTMYGENSLKTNLEMANASKAAGPTDRPTRLFPFAIMPNKVRDMNQDTK